MKCKVCKQDKLSKEFPSDAISDNCEHPPLHCIRCVISHWEKTKTCSQCNRDVPNTSIALKKCYCRIKALFPEITPEVSVRAGNVFGAKTVIVSLINGNSFGIPFDATMSISSLKGAVKKATAIDIDNQYLVHNGESLEIYNEHHSEINTLASYGIQPGAQLHLIKLLYAVPTDLDKVVFDLYWRFPESGLDYLDACAFAFEGQAWRGSLRFFNKQIFDGALVHSGDQTDKINKQGHQIIRVNLHKIPSQKTHIYFTLSSYKCETISAFRNPSVKFYAENDPDRMLCEDKSNQAGEKRSIIMCSLYKPKDKWLVQGNGTQSDGECLYEMEPLLKTIQRDIAKSGNYQHVPINVIKYVFDDPEEKARYQNRNETYSAFHGNGME